MSAETRGNAEITRQSLEKSNDNNSSGLESASLMTAKHQGKKSRTIKTT